MPKTAALRAAVFKLFTKKPQRGCSNTPPPAGRELMIHQTAARARYFLSFPLCNTANIYHMLEAVTGQTIDFTNMPSSGAHDSRSEQMPAARPRERPNTAAAPWNLANTFCVRDRGITESL